MMTAAVGHLDLQGHHMQGSFLQPAAFNMQGTIAATLVAPLIELRQQPSGVVVVHVSYDCFLDAPLCPARS
jgi:hypothetical protein